jgi:hypothetical protein
VILRGSEALLEALADRQMSLAEALLDRRMGRSGVRRCADLWLPRAYRLDRSLA